MDVPSTTISYAPSSPAFRKHATGCPSISILQQPPSIPFHQFSRRKSTEDVREKILFYSDVSGRPAAINNLQAQQRCPPPPKHAPPARRRNPKSLSIDSGILHNKTVDSMRRLSGIHKTLSSTFLSTSSSSSSSDLERPTTTLRPSSAHSVPSTLPLTPTLRTQPSGSITRSPSQKRKPPASHSSYGVETSLGPPPSYTTQRTLSEDRVWSVNRSSSTRSATSTAPERVTGQSNEGSHQSQRGPPSHTVHVPAKQELSALAVPRTSDPDVSSPETVDSLLSPHEGSDMTSATSDGGLNAPIDTLLRSTGLGLDGTNDDAKASSSDETHKSEDLFLNIAKTDASRHLQPISKAERRRSRTSIPFLPDSRQAAEVKPSPMPTPFESELLTPRNEEPRQLGKRSSLGQHVPGALTSAQYFDDVRSHVSRAMDDRSRVGSTTERSETQSRRHSNANVDTLRPPTRSYTGRTSRLASESLYADRLKAAEQPATESTISTTAPSTVWDELDDLKSRIRKLELTGKLPPSSAAAMSSTERPRTATTQATTMSSSPKHKPAVATLPSQIEGIPSTVHPLLHEALTNAKSIVSHEVYQKLQATAQDALQLSAMMNHEGYSGPSSSMSLASERQIRRRTESMCRSLTELAIAMAAEQRSVASPTQRPGSRDTYAQPAAGLRSRRLSNEPSDRPPLTSRVQSRLESRRTSLNMAQSQSPATSQPATSYYTPPPPASVVSTSLSNRVPRHTSSVRSRRAPSQLDGTIDDADTASSIRPVSRAQTDVNVPSNYRTLARDRAVFSREYTKQHPLPIPASTHIASQHAESRSTIPPRSALPSSVSIVSRRNVSNHTTPQSTPPQHGTYPQTIFHRHNSDEHHPTSSPLVTPSYTQRPPFTISIERNHPTYNSSPVTGPTALPQTPDSTSSPRTTSTRRSLGFASRISNVSSRLKAARAERQASATQTPPAANTGVVRAPLDGAGKDGDVVGVDQENQQPVGGVVVPERSASIGVVRRGQNGLETNS